jgi:hypothetical protein
VYFWTKFIFVEAYSSQWGYYYYLRHIPGFSIFFKKFSWKELAGLFHGLMDIVQVRVVA